MPEFTNPYDAVIADLEAKRAEIDNALQLMKRLRDGVGTGLAPITAVAVGLPVGRSGDHDLSLIPTDAFFNMTIGDAAVKFLEEFSMHRPQNTKTIIEALAAGGLKGKAYPTVYGILNRRAERQKDVVNVHGDWGLAEWYGPAKTQKRIKIGVPASSLKEPRNDSDPQEEAEPTT